MGKSCYRHIEWTTPLGNVSEDSDWDPCSHMAAEATEKVNYNKRAHERRTQAFQAQVRVPGHEVSSILRHCSQREGPRSRRVHTNKTQRTVSRERQGRVASYQIQADGNTPDGQLGIYQ